MVGVMANDLEHMAQPFFRCFGSKTRPNWIEPYIHKQKPKDRANYTKTLWAYSPQEETRRGKQASMTTTCPDAQHPMNTRQDDAEPTSAGENEARRTVTLGSLRLFQDALQIHGSEKNQSSSIDQSIIYFPRCNTVIFNDRKKREDETTSDEEVKSKDQTEELKEKPEKELLKESQLEEETTRAVDRNRTRKKTGEKPPSTPTRCDAEAKAGCPSPEMSAKTPEAKPADHQKKSVTPETETGRINPNPVERRRTGDN
ncbi:hypothetical protein YC2023_119451 [Brassica napus]